MSNARNLANLLNADTTLTASDIADGSITTAKIADSAISTAKIANTAVTSGKLASGVVSTPQYTFIERKEYTIASSASSNGTSIGFFNTSVTSSYNNYRVVLSNIIGATNATDIMIRVSTDNGSSGIVNNQQQTIAIRLADGSSDSRDDDGVNSFRIIKNLSNSTINVLGGQAVVDIFNTGTTSESLSKSLFMRYNATEFRNDGHLYESRGGGYIAASARTSMINAIFFITQGNGGNINTAVCSLYGMNES